MLLPNVLRATTACNFSSLISPDVSAPAALASLLFNPPESGAPKPRKNTVFRDFPIFSRTCIFFPLIFSLLTLLPADCFFISPYCRKFDFQTSFDNYNYFLMGVKHQQPFELRAYLVGIPSSKDEMSSPQVIRFSITPDMLRT